jgi:hypothetical protein
MLPRGDKVRSQVVGYNGSKTQYGATGVKSPAVGETGATMRRSRASEPAVAPGRRTGAFESADVEFHVPDDPALQ